MRKKWVKKGGGEEQDSPGDSNFNFTQNLAQKIVQTTIAEVSEDEEDDRGTQKPVVQMPAELSPLRKK